MSDNEAQALMEELEALGVQFTVVPRLDGTLRLNTWRTHNSWLNRDRINRLLAERIDSSPELAAAIAELISKRSEQTVAKSSSDQATTG